MKTTNQPKKNHKVRVEIFGQEYQLKSDNTSEEYMMMVANYVDSKMKELSSQFSHRLSHTQLAILAAINITDELFQERNKAISEEIVLNKTKYLIQLLEEGILGDPVI
ncbi:MAG: cell division protein ZapA [Leptospiraceae bacterium]|nr:cell division protein ZapA [Leptospiraceae bacterium]MDW7975925.1 cell division protein ZapA [Leptospiraceae bacterium]